MRLMSSCAPARTFGMSGVVIGGCPATDAHPDSCLTSPIVDTTPLPLVWLSYWRKLHLCNYNATAASTVQVYDGDEWVEISMIDEACVNSGITWIYREHDVTQYSNPNFQVRFCFRHLADTVGSGGGWNVDDVLIGSTPQHERGYCTPDP